MRDQFIAAFCELGYNDLAEDLFAKYCVFDNCEKTADTAEKKEIYTNILAFLSHLNDCNKMIASSKGCFENLLAHLVVVDGVMHLNMTGSLRNQSKEPWIQGVANPINFSYHVLDQNLNIVLFDGPRCLAEFDRLNADDKFDFKILMQISDEYIKNPISLTLVQEGNMWFEQHGFECATINQ